MGGEQRIQTQVRGGNGTRLTLGEGRTESTDPGGGIQKAVGGIRWENPVGQSQAVETEGCRDSTQQWWGENTIGGTESGRTGGVGENGQAGLEETHRQEWKKTGERDEGL